MIKNSFDLLYLISCALHDACPAQEVIGQMDISQVFKLAEFHSLLSISFSALEKYIAEGGTLSLDADKLKIWQKMREHIIQKNVLFDFEREKLIAFFEQNGIRYMPLKGLILHKLYPKMGWRYFADNDILFDRAYRKEVHDFFVEQGYKVNVYENNVHDIYLKEPFYNFEMHIDLFEEKYEDASVQRIADYYADAWRYTVKSSGEFEHRLTDEDFYVYLVAHAYKHVRYGGTGLRTLVDIYVFLWRKGDVMDRDYIAQQLDVMGILDFEIELRELSYHLFNVPKLLDHLDPVKQELLLMHTSAGTFGTFDRMIKLRIERSGQTGQATLGAKILYCLRRVFPDMEYYRVAHPYLYKHRIWIPAFVVWRFFRSIFLRDSAVKELRVLKKTKTDRSRW